MELFRELRETYLRYLDSPFDLRYQPLVDERRAMLDRDGRLYRAPLLEPAPPYVSSNQAFGAAAASLLGGTWTAGEIFELARLLDRASFLRPAICIFISISRSRLYSRDRADIVVTSGTGSGKTECFLLLSQQR